MKGCELGIRHSLGRRCVLGDGGDGVGKNTFLREKMHPLGDGAREKMFLGRRWAEGEDVGLGEDILWKEGGIGEEMNLLGWIVATEEVGMRMVIQGGDGAREKVGLGGEDP
jgi:hypothetical protein